SPRSARSTRRSRANGESRGFFRTFPLPGQPVSFRARRRSAVSCFSGRAALTANPDRPIPRANTGSAFWNWVADTSTALVHLQRRFDPFLRPAFDVLLRDPIADLVTRRILRSMPDLGLKLAEERILPDEEKYVDSVIDSFDKQMRGLWKPGLFERGGNTK